MFIMLFNVGNIIPDSSILKGLGLKNEYLSRIKDKYIAIMHNGKWGFVNSSSG